MPRVLPRQTDQVGEESMSVEVKLICIMAFMVLVSMWAASTESKQQRQNMKVFAEAAPAQQLQMIYQKQQEIEQRVNILQALVMCK